MREVDWFFSSLTVLQSADFEMAEDDDIYRMGVMAQFSVTFELAWKALRAVLQLYGVDADTESCCKMLGLRIPGESAAVFSCRKGLRSRQRPAGNWSQSWASVTDSISASTTFFLRGSIRCSGSRR